MHNGLSTSKTPLIIALSLAFTPSCVLAYGEAGPEVVRSISLVKKPENAANAKKMKDLASTMAKAKDTDISLFHNDIARELNKYPGLFATHSIVNGQSVTVAHNSPPGLMAMTVTQDDRNLHPLPYLDRSLLSFSSINRRNFQVNTVADITMLPTGLVGPMVANKFDIAKRGSLDLGGGSDNEAEINFDYGHEKGRWGHLFQLAHQQVDSYRESKTEFDNDKRASDVLLKVSERGGNLGSANLQNTEFSMHYREYENNESRMGVSFDDIKSNPQKRYSATALDNEKTEQLSFGLHHDVTLVSGELIKTVVYYDDGQASFYQTANVNGLDGEQAAAHLSQLEQAPIGNATISKDSLTRDYASGGLKISVHQRYGAHDASIGVNYHSETINDHYFTDEYLFDSAFALTLIDGELESGRAKTTLRAKSFFIKDRWHYGNLTVDVGLKHESLKRDYLTADNMGTNNESTHTLGNVSVSYQLSESLDFFVSGYEGLLPSGNWLTPALPIASENINAGLTYQANSLSFTLVGFNNEFNNVFVRCFNIQECETRKDERNDITIRGAQMSAKYLYEMGSGRIPLSFSYTYRDHEYASEFDQIHVEHQASIGDELAFMPKHQAFAQVGYQSGQWDIAMRASYRSDQRREPGVGSGLVDKKIDAVTLVDLSAKYKIDEKQSLYATLNNVTDKVYVESALNGTSLMGKPRSLLIGYRMNF